MPLGQAGQAMWFVDFQHITLQHGVVGITLDLYPVVGKHMAVVFDVLAKLLFRRVFQPGFQPGQHLIPRQLFGRTRVIMGQGNVGRFTRFDTEADADNLCHHLIQRGGFGVQSRQFGRLQAGQPAIKSRPGQHRVVSQGRAAGSAFCRGSRVAKQIARARRRGCFACIARSRRVARRCCASRSSADGFGQTFEAVTLVKLGQARHVFGMKPHRIHGGEAGQPGLQIAIGFDGHQLPPGGQPVERLAQVFTRHAFDGRSICHHPLKGTEFTQPFGGRHGPDFFNTRHVVHRITHQRLVIHHQGRWHAEFFGHTGNVALFAIHRVDDGDLRVHQLAQVFVTTRYHHLQALRRSGHAQRANHIVGFHP